MGTPGGVRLLLAVLAATLAPGACAAGPGPAPAATAPAPRDGMEEGPFRLRILRAWPDPTPEGDVSALIDAKLEPRDGSPFPEGRWFFEAARVAEWILLPDDRRLSVGEVIGAPSGYAPEMKLYVNGLPSGSDRIRRLVLDVPMIEILEGSTETVTLEPGVKVTRIIEGVTFGFEDREDGPGFGTFSGNDDDSGTERFYRGWPRELDHAWELRDAEGRRMVAGAGGGSSGSGFLYDLRFEDFQPGVPARPLTVVFRVPRRWRVAVQRFVIEDLRLERPPE